MSSWSVRKAIKTAMENNVGKDKAISADEAKGIVKVAEEDGKVERGELKRIRELVEDGKAITPSGNMMTMRVPELNKDQFYLSKGARVELEGFIQRNAATAVPDSPAQGQTSTGPATEKP